MISSSHWDGLTFGVWNKKNKKNKNRALKAQIYNLKIFIQKTNIGAIMFHLSTVMNGLKQFYQRLLPYN